jgi:hypothetical protein
LGANATVGTTLEYTTLAIKVPAIAGLAVLIDDCQVVKLGILAPEQMVLLPLGTLTALGQQEYGKDAPVNVQVAGDPVSSEYEMFVPVI